MDSASYASIPADMFDAAYLRNLPISRKFGSGVYMTEVGGTGHLSLVVKLASSIIPVNPLAFIFAFIRKVWESKKFAHRLDTFVPIFLGASPKKFNRSIPAFDPMVTSCS